MKIDSGSALLERIAFLPAIEFEQQVSIAHLTLIEIEIPSLLRKIVLPRLMMIMLHIKIRGVSRSLVVIRQ